LCKPILSFNDTRHSFYGISVSKAKKAESGGQKESTDTETEAKPAHHEEQKTPSNPIKDPKIRAMYDSLDTRKKESKIESHI
jgi:hypothetical protein